MDLDERKKQILQAIVENYIDHAEPVGSRTIAKNSELNLSAATIRNEMGDLEELGLLVQPHTSAGRVPSQMGYRYYVDSLMRRYRVTAGELSEMRRAIMLKVKELDETLKTLSAAFSGITNMPTLAAMPVLEYGVIRGIKVVGVDSCTIMVIISADSGVIKNKLLRLKTEVSDDFLRELNTILNRNLAGLTLSEINLSNVIEVQNAVGDNLEILTSVLELVHEAISEIDNQEIILEGANNILRFPEYNDIEKVKEIFDLFEDREYLTGVISSIPKGDRVKIIIGEESNVPRLRENSIVLSTYKLGENMAGVIGIIGPVRMDYSKAVSKLEIFSGQIENALRDRFLSSGTNLEGDGEGGGETNDR